MPSNPTDLLAKTSLHRLIMPSRPYLLLNRPATVSFLFVPNFQYIRAGKPYRTLVLLTGQCILAARQIVVLVVIAQIGEQPERCFTPIALVRIFAHVRFHVLHHVVALREAALTVCAFERFLAGVCKHVPFHVVARGESKIQGKEC